MSEMLLYKYFSRVPSCSFLAIYGSVNPIIKRNSWEQTTAPQTSAKGGEIQQTCISYHNINWLLGKNIPSFSSVKKNRGHIQKGKKKSSVYKTSEKFCTKPIMMVLRIMIKVIAVNIYGPPRPSLVPSGLHDLSYLSIPATLWCKYYYPHFTDKATETQTSLPSS